MPGGDSLWGSVFDLGEKNFIVQHFDDEVWNDWLDVGEDLPVTKSKLQVVVEEASCSCKGERLVEVKGDGPAGPAGPAGDEGQGPSQATSAK